MRRTKITPKKQAVDVASVKRYMQKAIEAKGANVNIATVKRYVQKSMKDRGMKPPSIRWPGWHNWWCYIRCYMRFKRCIKHYHPLTSKKQGFDTAAVKRYMQKAMEDKGVNVNMATAKRYVQKAMKGRGMKPPHSGWHGWPDWWHYMRCLMRFKKCTSHCHHCIGPYCRPCLGPGCHTYK